MDVDISVPRVIPSFRNDPYAPILFASPPVVISREQEDAVRTLLLLTSSDTRFAQKAADGLRLILAGGVYILPTITSIQPSSAPTGTTGITFNVNGEGFEPGSVILINGNEMPTTVVNANKVTTPLNLQGVPAGKYNINVKTPKSLVSNVIQFTVT